MTFKKLVRTFFRNPLAVLGLVLLLFFVAVAILAPVLAPPVGERGRLNPYRIPRDGFSAPPEPPSEEHPFGTTEGQYDIYYGVVWGTRTAFQVGIAMTVATLLIGLVVGSIAAYYGGWVDELLMRIVEIFQAFPFLLAAITLSAVLQAKLGKGLLTGMIALVAFGWTTYARLIRGDILAVRQRDYVLAARSVGVKDLTILVRHIIPNAIFPTIVLASMRIGDYVLSFAGLSFLGLGTEVGYADWGQLISFARNWIPALAEHWYILVYPGAAIVLFVLAWNLVGDAFRDIMDPRLQGSR
ncbi:MAG: ABC transporter permease [Chloroflexi bacterium]|nr:ABC transporter permease [Chloroflexota bacterium]